jgi:hypothetical protein
MRRQWNFVKEVDNGVDFYNPSDGDRPYLDNYRSERPAEAVNGFKRLRAPATSVTLLGSHLDERSESPTAVS